MSRDSRAVTRNDSRITPMSRALEVPFSWRISFVSASKRRALTILPTFVIAKVQCFVKIRCAKPRTIEVQQQQQQQQHPDNNSNKLLRTCPQFPCACLTSNYRYITRTASNYMSPWKIALDSFMRCGRDYLPALLRVEEICVTEVQWRHKKIELRKYHHALLTRTSEIPFID